MHTTNTYLLIGNRSGENATHTGRVGPVGKSKRLPRFSDHSSGCFPMENRVDLGARPGGAR
jgi:hypothetical protein